MAKVKYGPVADLTPEQEAEAKKNAEEALAQYKDLEGIVIKSAGSHPEWDKLIAQYDKELEDLEEELSEL